MNKNKNLKPFKKGFDERRNLDGRPKELPELNNLLTAILSSETERGQTVLESILMTLARLAIAGDIRAAEVLFNRAYGKVKDADEKKTNQPVLLNLIISKPETADQINQLGTSQCDGQN